MRYCVIKDTTQDIDSNQSDEIMLQNAQNAGFSENEVEIVTEEEYLTRRELEPKQPHPITEIEKLKIIQAEQFETILEILGGM